MTGRTRGTTAPVPGGTRSPTPGAYQAYHWALGVFLLFGAVQIFLAGLGVFSSTGDPGFGPHRIFGFVIAAVALVIVVLAVVARAGSRHTTLSVVVLLLAGGVQSLLAGLGEDNAWFGGLHALDGLLIIGLAGYLFGASAPPRSPARRHAA